MDAKLKADIDEVAAIATDLHARLDKLVATRTAGKLQCTFLRMARAAASDVAGHIGAQVSSTQPAPDAPAVAA